MFKKHLTDHGITYFQHMHLAFFFAKESFKAAFMAFIHGIFPILFETSASETHKNILPKYMEKLEKYKVTE